MPKKLQLRPILEEEYQELQRISRSRIEAARRVERAKMVLALGNKERVATIAALEDAPKSGRPPTYSEEQRGQLIAVARTHPQQLDLSFGHWTLDVRLWLLAHEHVCFLFQPTYAPWLNLIEPWWKILRSLALKGRCFDTLAQLVAAIDLATSYWNCYRRPYVWRKAA